MPAAANSRQLAMPCWKSSLWKEGSSVSSKFHARVERLLGEPIPKSSVKNSLAKRSSGADPLFERVGRGLYRLRHG
jgi:hypothetical protein